MIWRFRDNSGYLSSLLGPVLLPPAPSLAFFPTPIQGGILLLKHTFQKEHFSMSYLFMNRVKYIYHLIAFIYIYNPYTFIHISFKALFLHHSFEVTLSIENDILHAPPSYGSTFISFLFLIHTKYVRFPFTRFMHVSLSYFSIYILRPNSSNFLFSPFSFLLPRPHTHTYTITCTHTFGIPSN